jgi:hypothetical protein
MQEFIFLLDLWWSLWLNESGEKAKEEHSMGESRLFRMFIEQTLREKYK